MRIGIMGSGFVAQTLGAKLLEMGHEVTVSSRDVSRAKKTGWGGDVPSAQEWAAARVQEGQAAACGSFAQAAAGAEVVINATMGAHSLDALATVSQGDLSGKVLVDLSNPLDYSGGGIPTLAVANTTSVAEQIQADYPAARVVKTLNTVNVGVMIAPARLGAETDMFVAGNDEAAKRWVAETMLREWLGWSNVIDLGDNTAARGQEMYLPLWLRLMGALGTADINIRIVKGA